MKWTNIAVADANEGTKKTILLPKYVRKFWIFEIHIENTPVENIKKFWKLLNSKLHLPHSIKKIVW